MVRLLWAVAMLFAAVGSTALAQEQVARSQIVQGSCSSSIGVVAELDAPVFPVGESTGAPAARTAGTSFSVAPLALFSMLREPHALLVSLDGHRIVCAEIGGVTNDSGDLVLGLSGVRDSDAFGVAYLSPNDADPSQTDVSLFIVPPETQETDAIATGEAEELTSVEETTPSDIPSAGSTPAGTSTRSFEGSPIAESNGIELLYYYFGEPGFSDRTPIYGELRNTTTSLMQAPTLNLTFYDSEDRLVDTAEVTPVISILQPGETMPIEGATDLTPGSWAREEFTLDGADVATDISLIFFAQGLEIQDVNEVAKTDDALRVLGKVHNAGATAANLLIVKVLFYDADGRFAGYAFGQTSGDSVPAGGDVSFEVDRSVDLASGWTYRIVVSGWPE
jgi:hypothetical protein